MSQSGVMSFDTTKNFLQTLTGNSGGAVPPDGSGNINLLGNNGTGINIVGTPLSNLLTVIGLASTEVQVGTVRLATAAETTTATSQTLAVDPAGLNTRLGAQTLNGLIYGGGGAGTNLAALAAATNGQLPIGNTGNPPTLATLTAGTGVTITNGAGSITISATGTTTLNYTGINHTASPYTVLSTDDYIGANSTAGVISVLLPNAPATGRVFIVKDSNGQAVANNITVTTVGGVVTIDGATSYVMKTNYQSIEVIFNGTSYEVF